MRGIIEALFPSTSGGEHPAVSLGLFLAVILCAAIYGSFL